MDRPETTLPRCDARRWFTIVVCACAVTLSVSPASADSWIGHERFEAASQDFVTLDALAGVSLTSPETTPLAPELQALNAITGLGDSGSPTAHVTQASDATSRSAAKEQQKEWAAIGGREDVTWKEGSLLDGWAWNAMGATIVVIGFALATIYVSAGRMKTLAPAHHRQEPASSIKILAEHALPYRSKLLLVSAADELFLVGVDPNGMKSMTSVMALPAEEQGSADDSTEPESRTNPPSVRTGLRFPWPALVTEDEPHGGQSSLQRAA